MVAVWAIAAAKVVIDHTVPGWPQSRRERQMPRKRFGGENGTQLPDTRALPCNALHLPGFRPVEVIPAKPIYGHQHQGISSARAAPPQDDKKGPSTDRLTHDAVHSETSGSDNSELGAATRPLKKKRPVGRFSLDLTQSEIEQNTQHRQHQREGAMDDTHH